MGSRKPKVTPKPTSVRGKMRLSGLSSLPVLLAALLAACTPHDSGVSVSASSPTTTSDIVSVGDGIELGTGWYPFEQFKGEQFRWAKNNAEILACPDSSHHELSLSAESGPSVGNKDADLFVYNGRIVIQKVKIRGKAIVDVHVPGSSPVLLRLNVPSKNLSVPKDKRILNLRVFSLALGSEIASCGKDVVHTGLLRLGSGWYAPEVANGAPFRWVGRDASIFFAKAANNVTVEADLEPGPGLGGKPLNLTASDAHGTTLAIIDDIKQREFVSIQFHQVQANERITLRVKGGGKRVFGDTRVLDYRIFQLQAN